MEQILYYISINSKLLRSFLILMFLIGAFCFLTIKKFKQNNKWKIIFYGLFMQMSNLDILKISIMLVKCFVIFYSIFLVEKIQSYSCLIIIGILGIGYSIVYSQRFVFEIINSIIQLLGIYVAFSIKNSYLYIEDTTLVIAIYYFIIIFLIIFTIYNFFTELEEITRKRAIQNNEKLNMNRKELRKND